MNVKIPLLTLQFPSAKGLARIPKKRSASQMTPGTCMRERGEGGGREEGGREGERRGEKEGEREEQGRFTLHYPLRGCSNHVFSSVTVLKVC